MSSYRAHDDPDLGAPYALCFQDEVFRSLAPASCILVAGSAPPQFAFSRHDFFWLTLCLSSCDSSDAAGHPLDSLMYGLHTLKWQSMHEALSMAVANGFSVPFASDTVAAVKSALMWSLGQRPMLRRLTAADFEPLPSIDNLSREQWWLHTAYSSWESGGQLHALCHALGFAGQFWDAPSRTANSRFHFSLLLTQEFLTISPALPVALHGDPAVQFYLTTMPPPQLLSFPTDVSRLHSALTVRWGYMHGSPPQLHAVLMHVLPLALRECVNLPRFLLPAESVVSQVNAYKVLAGLLAPASEAHKFDTIKQVDGKLAAYLHLACQADDTVPPVLAEARAMLLQQAMEEERNALMAAPLLEPVGNKYDRETPATQTVLQALRKLRTDPTTTGLEKQLLRFWGLSERRPVEVFRIALASRSLTCVAILFGNLIGVASAGPIYAVLEQASKHRISYFSYVLSTPEDVGERPDHTLWYTYPALADSCVRSPDLSVFSKLNLFELGATVRQLREAVTVTEQDAPKPGQEFTSGMMSYHLSLLGHLSLWLQALGFPLGGKAGFDQAYREFISYCQQGTLYTGGLLANHILGMQRVFQGFVYDLHQSFQGFWNRKLESYEQEIDADNMFPQSGRFYGTLRQVKADVTKVNDWTRLGVAFVHDLPSSVLGKRARYGDHGSPGDNSTSSPAKIGKKHQLGLGSFSWAVRDDAEFITVGNTKYAKGPILEKLKLKDSEICLASYLSWKGAEACPYAGKAGHETMTSPLHVYSDEVTELRQTFEHPPYQVSDAEASTSGASTSSAPAASGRGKGKGGFRGGRGSWK